MSTFIQIPSNLKKIESRSKFLELYTYLLIRNQIKVDYKASISESEIAKTLGCAEISVKRYISNLKEYFSGISLYHRDNNYPYNVYHFSKLEKDFSIILPSLITDDELTPEEKGILIKIKLCCEKGTNYIKFNTKTDLINIIGISKNLINKKIGALIEKGYLKYIDNTLNITSEHFPLSLNLDGNSVSVSKNRAYEMIYNHCVKNNVVPPLRETKALNYIISEYPEVDLKFYNDLQNKFKNMPSEISLDYFVKGLRNLKVQRINLATSLVM